MENRLGTELLPIPVPTAMLVPESVPEAIEGRFLG
jgi:hypothetical protein